MDETKKLEAERADLLDKLTTAMSRQGLLVAALEGLLDRAERQAAGMLEEASCEIWYAHRDRCRAALAVARGSK